MLGAKQSALNSAGPCQSPELLASSSPYPRFLIRLRLLFWYKEREGLLGTPRRAAIALVPGLRTARRKAAPVGFWEDEIQNLQSGEWVEVKSRDKILSTLDPNAQHRGLRFVPEMYDFCGRRFRIFKRVEKICIENPPNVRRITNTALLEGESVREVSAATEPAFISGAKYGYAEFLRFIRSTECVQSKDHIL